MRETHVGSLFRIPLLETPPGIPCRKRMQGSNPGNPCRMLMSVTCAESQGTIPSRESNAGNPGRKYGRYFYA
jgi:hypothetical protein